MSPSRLVVVLLFAFGSSLARAQQTATTSPPAAATEGAAVLQKALAALAPTTRITDVTLSGTARRIAGSDDESGTVLLKALATGESRLDLTFPSGPRTEVRANSPTGPVGSWSGPDATSHSISQHNLWTDSSWFFPAFALARVLNDPSFTISDLGLESRNGQSVEHLAVSRQFQATGAPAGRTSPLPELSRTDIYLDSTSFLPAAIVFNDHPDRNQTINIPVEIRLSSYQQTNGALIPLHVQQYLNNSLALDFQLSAFAANSGIPSSTFSVQ